MTYTCIAKKGVHEIQETGFSEKNKESFYKKYESLGYKVISINESLFEQRKHTDSTLKRLILEFYREHCLTTIEIGEKEVDNWMERRNGNG